MFTNIIMGGLVRSLDGQNACPDWPTCLGKWALPADVLLHIESIAFWHRALSLLSFLSVIGVFYLVVKSFRREKIYVVSISGILFLMGVQIILGSYFSNEDFSGARNMISAGHLGLSIFIEALLVLACVAAFFNNRERKTFGWHIFRAPFMKIAIAAFFSLLILLISGMLVSRSQAANWCAGWPLCNPMGGWGWLALGHRIWVGVTGIFVFVHFIQGWRTQRSQAVVLISGTAVFVLFWAQALLGSQITSNQPLYLIILHQVTASAVWVAMVVQISALVFTGRTPEAEQVELHEMTLRKNMFLDVLLLTKPIVVALLLVTTYAGMVIGGKDWPDFSLAFWTLIGGFLAAGGSGAINQFIDRNDDSRMQRTQKRPIPSGRLTPAEGLAVGTGMLLSSFFVFVAFVNLLAAVLSLAGMVYYVLIYSLWLKKMTVQNIVIGGGAGAIPPLVGWAAATGTLDIPAFFLFVVVFMWTPPHFWALALVRKNDYARAGVPMLPVVRGEEETRWQIFIYTVLLLILTLLLPIFGLGGSVYIFGAVILGVWLFGSAWRLLKHGGNKLAWKMYRYSSMYLAFLFLVMMVDAVVQ